jgi:hypothetical protein
MSEARAPGDLAADFFVLRTPLLPFDELEAWSAGLAAPGSGPDELEAAVAADRERLRDRLRVLIDRPEVRYLSPLRTCSRRSTAGAAIRTARRDGGPKRRWSATSSG